MLDNLVNSEKCSHQCQFKQISVGGSGGFHLCYYRCSPNVGALVDSEKTKFQNRLYTIFTSDQKIM